MSHEKSNNCIQGIYIILNTIARNLLSREKVAKLHTENIQHFECNCKKFIEP